MNRIVPFLPDRAAIRPLAALLVLVLTAWTCAEWGFGGADRRLGTQALGLAETLRSAARPLRLTLRSGPPVPDGEQRAASARSLLSGLDRAASHAGVQVTRLTPRPGEPGTIGVDLLASYGQLVRFVAESEALGGVVKGFQIKPAEAADPQGRQVATFSLEVGTEPPRLAGLAEADQVAVTDALRLHPFQSPQLSVAGQDLSARFHLTGITRIGSDRMATIGGRDYLVGEELDEFRIARISDTEVGVSAVGCDCLIRFRQAPR